MSRRIGKRFRGRKVQNHKRHHSRQDLSRIGRLGPFWSWRFRKWWRSVRLRREVECRED